MKKKTTTLFAIFISMLSLAQTQSWLPIRTDETYFYKGDGEYRAFHIDSIAAYSDSTIMYSYAEVFAFDLVDCINPFGPSWIGNKIKVNDDSTFIYNNNNKAITLLHNPKVGSTWNLYAYSESHFIEAEVTGKTYGNIGFTEDSILTIKLSSTDTLNGKEIIISKNHGMVKGFNFLLFPDLTNEFQNLATFKLSGQVSNTTSEANITAREIYNFEVGDEFHSHYYSYSVSGKNAVDIRDKKFIKKVTTKTYNTDSSKVTYTFNQCDNSGEHLTEQTISLTPSYMDALPYKAIWDDSSFLTGTESSFIYGIMEIHSNNLRYKEFGGYYLYQYDSCYQYIIIDKKKAASFEKIPFVMQDGMYIEGCGGPYYSHNFMFSGESYNLTYYKKGSKEWGTPYNCKDIVGVDELSANVKLKIYPNPASTFIIVESPVFSSKTTLTISNILGQKLMEVKLIKNTQSISISNLPAGLLFYQYISPDKDIQKGSFIKN